MRYKMIGVRGYLIAKEREDVMARRRADQEAQEIFEKLRQSTWFLPGYEKEKLSILGKLLAMRKDLQCFASSKGREEYQINGYLVELCTQFSTQIPRNTPRAEKFSAMIISYLQENGLHAPDYIWMKIHGRRITISGLGEVKSHPRVVLKNPSQTLFQEQNIKRIVKNGLLPHLLKTKAKVVYEQESTNYLVVPRLGTNRSFHLPRSMPVGWEIQEIEFSFPELMFLKPLLLTDPKPETPAYPTHLYEPFVNTLIGRMDTIIGTLFQKVPTIKKGPTRSALVVWNILFKTLPTTQDAVHQVLLWAQELQRKNMFVCLLLTQPPQSVFPICKADKKSAIALKKSFNEIAQIEACITAFLIRIQEVKKTVSSLNATPVLLHKKDVDLFTLI